MVYSFAVWQDEFLRCRSQAKKARLVRALAQSFDVLFDHAVLDHGAREDVLGEYWCVFAQWVPARLFAQRLGAGAQAFAAVVNKNMLWFAKGLASNALTPDRAPGEFASGLAVHVREFVRGADMLAFVVGLGARESSLASQSFFQEVSAVHLAQGLSESGQASVLDAVPARVLAAARSDDVLLRILQPVRALDVLERQLADGTGVRVSSALVASLVADAGARMPASTFAGLCERSPAQCMVGAGLAGFGSMSSWSEQDWRVFFEHSRLLLPALFEAARPFSLSWGHVLRGQVDAMCVPGARYTEALGRLGDGLDGFLHGLGLPGVARLIPHVEGTIHRKCVEFLLRY